MATRQQCLRALEHYDETLSGHANVVGLGVVPLEPHVKRPRDFAIAVYVKSAAQTQAIPQAVRVRGKKGDVEIPVRIIETGEFELESDEFGLE